MSTASTPPQPAPGKLQVQVELFCPFHQSSGLVGSAARPAPSRRLPIFRTRVSSPKDARRKIVDTLKRHISVLRDFEKLSVSFQPSAAAGAAATGPARGQLGNSKAAFESAIVRALSTNTVLALRVLPVQNVGKKSVCFCPAAPATTQPAAALATSSSSNSSNSNSTTSTATQPAASSSKKSSAGESAKAGKPVAQPATANEDLVKEKAELATKLVEANAKHSLVLARLAELESQHKALQVQLNSARSTDAAESSALAPRWQSFCNDLLKNLNASMSANLGEEVGTFSFQPTPQSTPKQESPNHCCSSESAIASKNLDAAPACKSRTTSSADFCGPKVMPGHGGHFYCDICKRSCRGEDRYRCLRCPDWDACTSCALYGLGEHGHTKYAFIPARKELSPPAYRPLATASSRKELTMPKEFGQMCSNCTVSPRDGVLYHYAAVSTRVQTDLCTDCFTKGVGPPQRRSKFIRIEPRDWEPSMDGPALRAASRLPHARPANGAETARAKSADLKYFCDLCLGDIDDTEHRYRCATCPEFDVCEGCYDSCKVDLHKHAGYIEYGPSRVLRQSSKVMSNPTAAPSTGPVVHSATCDICDLSIVGSRLKCLSCPDFDVCSKPSCIGLLPAVHAGHHFVRIAEPALIRKYDAGPRHDRGIQSANRFCCDGCDRTIRGIRYACIACPDLDLCANCEALPHKDPKSVAEVKTNMTAISHRLDKGLHHVFVKIPEAPLETSAGSFYRRNDAAYLSKEKSLQRVIDQARQSVCDYERSHELDLKMSNRGAPPPTIHWCGTARLEALRKMQAENNKAVPDAPLERGSVPRTSTSSTPAARGERSEPPLKRPCTVVHTLEPPMNNRLSYEEKRTLSKRMEAGGEAAVKAFTNALTPQQMQQVSPNGDLVFDMDDLTVEQFYNIMMELDALKASKEDAPPTEGLMDSKATTTAVPAESAPVPVSVAETKNEAAVEEQPATMSELSTSFKTIRAPSFDAPPKPQSEASVVDDKRADLDGEYVEDVSLPDGTVVAAGSRFDKVWLLRNSGKKPWPADVRLRFVAGDPMGLPLHAGETVPSHIVSASPAMAGLAPGSTCQVRLNALKAMDITGRSTSYFRLVAANKLDHDVCFGHQLWVDVSCVSSTDAEASFAAAEATSASVAGDAVIAATSPSESRVASAIVGTGTDPLSSSNSNSNSTARLGGSSVFTAPHAPESVRSDAGASSTGKSVRGYRLRDEIDSDDEDSAAAPHAQQQQQQQQGRNPFEDAVLNVSDDEDDDQVLDDDDSDFELVDPTTEESDVE